MPYYIVDDAFAKQIDILGDFDYGYFNDVKSIQFMGSIVSV